MKKDKSNIQSEEAKRLRAIFEFSHDGIITIDRRGTVESLNPAAAKLFGYAPEEVIGNNINMLMPEPYHGEHDGYMGNYHSTGKKKIIGSGREVKGKRKDGSVFPFFLSVSEVKLENETIYTGFIHDVSDVKLKEKELDLSQKRLNAIFESTVDGIIIIDTRGNIQQVNRAISKLFGYDDAEIIGKNVNMLMPEPYHGEHDGYMGNYHRTGKKKIIGSGREVKGKRKNGSVFPFFLSVNEIKMEEETIYVGFIHDISEIKQKQKELEVSRQRLNAIFDTAVDGIIIIDKKGIIQMVNPAVSRLFGYDDIEMIGNNIMMLMPEPHHSAHDSYLGNYQRTRIPKIIGIGREVEGLRKDGTRFPFNLGVSEVQTDEGVLYTGIIHDLSIRKKIEEDLKVLNASLEEKVTARTTELTTTVNKLLSTNKRIEKEVAERKKAEAALRESEKEIREALAKEQELSELKSRFVSMASHEFRTPLSTILSSSALIGRYTEGDQQDKREKHIKRIKSSVTNLTGILNDFLSISKLEEGKIENNPKELDFEALCMEVRDEIQGLLKSGQSIVHENHIPESMVFLDAKLLKNILFNLISNAIKYSPEGKPITCISFVENDYYVIKVKDQGIGIPKNDQAHMFSRFFRATNASTIQGTGLGLTIVRQYAELMGGDISFESEEGKGSTFIVKIPVKQS